MDKCLYHPLSLINALQNRAIGKKPKKEVIDISKHYFSLLRKENPNPFYLEIGDDLSFLCQIADKYGEDPINVLFSCGFVIFPEIITVDIIKLSEILAVNEKVLLRSFREHRFMSLSRLPREFNEKMFQLGYIDSTEWNHFLLPLLNRFSFFTGNHTSIVQSFPFELISIVAEMRDNMMGMDSSEDYSEYYEDFT